MQVDGHARKRESPLPIDAELALHQVEHRLGGMGRRKVEIAVETEHEPRVGRARDRHA